MLATRILDHVKAECAVFDPVAELEHLKLVLSGLVLLLRQVHVDVLHVLSGVLDPHLLGHVLVAMLHHGGVEPWDLAELDGRVDPTQALQRLERLDLPSQLHDALLEGRRGVTHPHILLLS